MADTPDLGSGPARGGGSSPLARTIRHLYPTSPSTILLRLDRARIHPNQFPDVSVEILEAMLVHETVVIGLGVGAAAGCHGLAHQFVDPGTTFARQRNQHFRTLGGVANRLWSELLELRVREQHRVDVLTDDHARGRVVGELGVELVAEAAKEFLGLGQVFHGEVNEYFCRHGSVDRSWFALLG